MSDYYILITDAGAALEAAAHASGEKVALAEFGVCDGGVDFIPDPTATTFPNEIDRWPISSLTISEDNAAQFVAQCIIPANSGGYTVRGIAIYASDGTLYATGNYSNQDKPAPDSGLAVSLEILAQLAVSDTADIELIVTDGSYLTELQADTLYLRQDMYFEEIYKQGHEAIGFAQSNLELIPQSAVWDTTPGRVVKCGNDVFAHTLLLDDGSGIPDNAVKVHVLNAIDDEGNQLPIFTFEGNINTAAGKEVWEQGKRVYSPNNEPAYPVTSVNNKTGAVTLSASDVNALPDTYTPPPPDLSGYITSAVAYSTFMQGFRMANYGTHGSEGVRDSSHTALTGIYATNGWDNPTTQEVRTPQFNINGSWYDAAYI